MLIKCGHLNYFFKDINELINNLLKVIDRMYIIGLRKLFLNFNSKTI